MGESNVNTENELSIHQQIKGNVNWKLRNKSLFIIIIMVYLLTALAAKQAEKVHLQVKIVCLKKYV